MIKNLIASIAAATMVFTPIAAQAGTRAMEYGVSMNALASVDRAGAAMGEAENQAEESEGIAMWLLIPLFGAAGLALILAIESGENNRSPGT